MKAIRQLVHTLMLVQHRCLVASTASCIANSAPAAADTVATMLCLRHVQAAV